MSNSDEPELHSQVLDGVRSALKRIDRRIIASNVQMKTSLVADLGIDSMRLVELALTLEDELGLSDLSLQGWAEAENMRENPRHTVGSLVALCSSLLRELRRTK